MQGALAQVKGFFGKLSKKVRILLAVALVVIIGVAIVGALILNNKPYEVLFTGLTSEEASSIISYLEDNGAVDYRLENGDTIVVPKEQEPMLKARLLMEDYPKSGFSYKTYLDNVGIMSTESERDTAFLFALQDRMAAVIRCFEGVHDANVTIAQGEDRRYVLDSSNVITASASVQVELEAGRQLSSQQAAAIRNLVTNAVKGLDIENVTIVDTNGNTYSSGDGAATGEASALKLMLEEKVNNQIRANVLQVLGPLYGEENVRVAVNSVVDVNRRVGESVSYASPEGAPEGKGIIGSQVYDQQVVRPSANAAGGVVGTTANADIPTYVQNQLQAVGDETYVKNSGTDNYHVNTDKEQVEQVAGTVTDVMVAVTINSATATGVNADALIGHVARAAGITPDVQADKISILSRPFYNPDEDTPGVTAPEGLVLPNWMLYAAIGGGILFILLLLLLLLLLGRKKKRKKAEAEALAAAAAEPTLEINPEDGVDIMDLNTERSMELRKDVRQFASDNPEIAAQMIKSWIREEGKDRG